jgi:orotate phosphoribosyltransferase
MDRDRQALVAEIAAVATLHGRFRLRSGATESTCFDKYLFEGQPRLLRPLGWAISGSELASALPAAKDRA